MRFHAKLESGVEPAPFGRYVGGFSILHAIGLVVVAGLLFVGLISDSYFSPIFLSCLSGGILVGLWLHHRERSFDVPSSAPNPRSQEVGEPGPQDLVPFGPYGGGQWTSHPIGFVIVIGFLLMGLVSQAPVSLLLLASMLGGVIVGFFLWLRHR
jgi:hypothetical protein